MSFRSDEAPSRYSSGVSHSGPSVSCTSDEMLHGLLRLPDPAGRLEADAPAGLDVDVAHRLEHAERHRERRGRVDLPRRGLHEVGARGDREQRRAAHVVVGAELAGLEDHLQVRAPARLLHLDDLVVDLRVAAREERPPVDHHVDLVRAELDGAAHVRDLHRRRVLAGREAGRDRRHLDARPLEPRPRRRDEVRVDADRGDGGHARVAGIGTDRLRGERGDLAGRVGALERRQVGGPDREAERPDLRVLLDRPLRERGGALLERHRVDRADARQPRLER